jgi:opacity protein-like surface antigen
LDKPAAGSSNIGYARADVDGNVINTTADKNVLQTGVTGTKRLSDKVRIYTILGGGDNFTNVEFGAAYALSPSMELNGIYRHLTVEKVGSANIKANLHGFGLGITYKF